MYYRRNPDVSFQEWFKEALPALILQHIIQAKAVKVCSGLSPIFGIIARYHGYEAYVVSTPRHFFNVVITPEGPVEIDLSAIQFRVCDFVEDSDKTHRDLYGVKKALKKVLRHIIRDPRRAVKIQPYEGPMEALQEPRINDLYYQYYLDSFKSALEDVEALRRRDPDIYELYDDIKHLEEWEADIEHRNNPQIICTSCQEIKPHYVVAESSHKLCYLCYRKLQCRWIEDIDEWFDSLEKPQCQNLMHKMGFCEEHWEYIQEQEKERKKRDALRHNPDVDIKRLRRDYQSGDMEAGVKLLGVTARSDQMFDARNFNVLWNNEPVDDLRVEAWPKVYPHMIDILLYFTDTGWSKRADEVSRSQDDIRLSDFNNISDLETKKIITWARELVEIEMRLHGTWEEYGKGWRDLWERQRNPEYSKLYYEGFEEPQTFGYTQKEIYKIILFADYLPQEEEQILRGNKWLIKNKHKLPVDIQEMRLEDVFLTVRTSEYRKNYIWNLTYHEDGPRLGGGIFCDSSKGPPGYDESGYHEDCIAGISLQGFGLYPTILKFMRGLLGPLRSDLTLTRGAMKAWIKAGGVSRSSPDSRISAAENRRWYLD